MFEKVVLPFIMIYLLLLPPPTLVFGGEEIPKSSPPAEAILKASNKRIYGIKDQTAQVTFRIINANGVEKKTVFRLYWKNYYGQENLNSKTLLVTESPANDKGQKFLIWEYIEEDRADLWLYLPELRQIRRVQPGRHHHENEPESDLLFEDMHQRRVDQDKHRLLEEEEVRGEICYVIESHHKEKSLYSKTVIYISKSEGTIRKIEYFSKKGDLLKTQWIDWQRIDGSFVWKASQIFNTHPSRKTFVEVSNVRVNVNLLDDQFSERVLRQ